MRSALFCVIIWGMDVKGGVEETKIFGGDFEGWSLDRILMVCDEVE
jgi:hypothetical protein